MSESKVPESKGPRRLSLFIIATMALFAVGTSPSEKSAEDEGASQPFTVPHDSPRPESSTNWADKVQVIGVDTKWAPASGDPRGPNLLWVQPRIKNNSSTPIGIIYAKLRFKDANGTALGSADDIIYFSPDLGDVKLLPGKSYSGDAHVVGSPFPIFRPNGSPVTRGPVKVDVSIESAWESPSTGRNGERIGY